MFSDELDIIERREKRDEREERQLIPIDSCSQLDTGYTGRPNGDMLVQKARDKEQRLRQLSAIAQRYKRSGFSLRRIDNPAVLKQFCAHKSCTEYALFYLVYRCQRARPSLYRRCAEHAQQDARDHSIELPGGAA